MEKESHHKHHRHRQHHRHHRSRSRDTKSTRELDIKKTSLLTKHKELMEKYKRMKEQLKPKRTDGIVTDADAIARNTQFIMDTDINKATNWEQRLAIRYYNRLFKEYALVDLTFYQINKIGMRWRTEKEVIEGKGQFACGNIHCDNSNIHDLCSYEVPFSYKHGDKKVTTLVKVRVCGPCAMKLHYKKMKEYEHYHPEAHRLRKNLKTSQDIFQYLSDMMKEETETPLVPPEISSKQDELIQPEKVHNIIKPKTIPKAKPKRKDGHSHYSSSSSSEDEMIHAESDKEEKMYDANGNEVISTSNDIWKTSVEVEHTENENMDDFINQLFM